MTDSERILACLQNIVVRLDRLEERFDTVVGRPTFTVQEAAPLLHLSPDTIYKKCRSGAMPHTKTAGGGIVFTREQIDEYLGL